MSEQLKAKEWKRKDCIKCGESAFSAKMLYCTKKASDCEDYPHIHTECTKCGFKSVCLPEDSQVGVVEPILDSAKEAVRAEDSHAPHFMSTSTA